MRKYRYN